MSKLCKATASVFAVVVVQVLVRCLTEGALLGLGDGFSVLNIDGLEWPAVFSLIGFKDSFEV